MPQYRNDGSINLGNAPCLRLRHALMAVVCVTTLISCERREDVVGNERVIVLAAASTIEAVEEIVRIFERGASIEVLVSTGPSNGLAQQIIAGAPADVFLSASSQWADAIAKQALAGETVELLSNRLVLIVPKGDPAEIKQVSDLGTAKLSRLALAMENVPAGIYAEQALQQLGLFDQLQESHKLARGSDVRAALAYVERGEAEAGIVYATDARISGDVEVVSELEPQSYGPVVYPAVLVKTAVNKAAARRFFEFLQSSEAQVVFARNGFRMIE